MPQGKSYRYCISLEDAATVHTTRLRNTSFLVHVHVPPPPPRPSVTKPPPKCRDAQKVELALIRCHATPTHGHMLLDPAISLGTLLSILDTSWKSIFKFRYPVCPMGNMPTAVSVKKCCVDHFRLSRVLAPGIALSCSGSGPSSTQLSIWLQDRNDCSDGRYYPSLLLRLALNPLSPPLA